MEKIRCTCPEWEPSPLCPQHATPEAIHMMRKRLAWYASKTGRLVAFVRDHVKIADRADDRECPAAHLQEARAILREMEETDG